MYVYVDSVVMPGIGADGIGYEGRKQPVEIKEEEESAITSTVHGQKSRHPSPFVEVIKTYRTPLTISSMRKTLYPRLSATSQPLVQAINAPVESRDRRKRLWGQLAVRNRVQR